jgi:hypothetical protein
MSTDWPVEKTAQQPTIEHSTAVLAPHRTTPLCFTPQRAPHTSEMMEMLESNLVRL